ncbi:DEAD-box ATP-dependent RNA helicase 51 [Ancistrocladus abbreviatus]
MDSQIQLLPAHDLLLVGLRPHIHLVVLPSDSEGVQPQGPCTTLELAEQAVGPFLEAYSDWIVQYDPPDDPKEYIHRVGRTARGEGARGNALLFLIPEELQFLHYLKSKKVPVKEYEFNHKKLANVQSLLEKLLASHYHLNKSAKDAYRSYILAYSSHSMKDVFNVHRLDLRAVAASFCFSCPPKVNLNIDSSSSKFRKKKRVGAWPSFGS